MTQPDSLFISLSALILTMNIRVFDPNFDTNSSRYFLMLLLISVLSFFFRPIGIVFSWWLLTTITIYLFWRRGIPLSTAFQCVIGMFVLALIVGTVLIHDPDLLPFGVLAKPLAIYHNEIFQGHVVWVRPETYVTGGDDIFSFLKVSILRVCYFFWFLADDFSFGHKVLNITFFPALYGFAVVGLYTACAATRADRMQISGWIALMATACVLSFAVFHAVTLLDYNWRYRGPVYPALFLLSAIGVQNVARTFMARGLPLPAFVHSLLKEAK
ncbi:MAG: hypothetical protein HN673_15265 [Rhodospirillales bacterium]|nr:hypothetical protein [Rhodospirillales bacterium]